MQYHQKRHWSFFVFHFLASSMAWVFQQTPNVCSRNIPKRPETKTAARLVRNRRRLQGEEGPREGSGKEEKLRTGGAVEEEVLVYFYFLIHFLF